MDKFSDRRLAENEVIFKQINSEVKDFVLEDGQDTAYASKSLRFFCECSNMDCRERILMPAKEYDKLHKGARYFIAKPGHDMRDIEDVVGKQDDYIIVRKKKVPPVPSFVDSRKLL